MSNSWMKQSSWMAAGFLAASLLVPRLHAAPARMQDHAVAEADQDAQDASQESRDRAQEARDREEEKRDREQEKRERAQEQVDRAQEAYDNGRDALDEDRFDRAEEKFAEVAKTNGTQADAALYWKAYAQNKLGKREAALATIADLKQRFPQSRWQKDAGALEIEVRQSSGQAARPENQSDDELKMLAIQGLMNSDPERAMPLLEKVLNGTGSPKEKSRAMFVMAQSGSPQAREILGRIARGQSNPDLQRKAVEYLALFGGAESRKTLADVYAASGDASVKRAVLKSFMISGDREHLFAAAKSEKDPALRSEAIRQLGLVKGDNELTQLYHAETSTELRRDILQAFFLAGDTDRLLEAARTEKDVELRRAAVRNLGLVGGDVAGEGLKSIYSQDPDRGVREAVLNALFIQGNAKALVAIARGEKDPELKKVAVQKLSLMNSKDSTDYMMELLQK
jgi:hypothetical protein